MNFELFTEDYMPLVMAACLILGYLIKKSLDVIPNRYIPSTSCGNRGGFGMCGPRKHFTRECSVWSNDWLGEYRNASNFKRFIEKEK